MNPPLDDLPPGPHLLFGAIDAHGERWYLDGQEWVPPLGLSDEQEA